MVERPYTPPVRFPASVVPGAPMAPRDELCRLALLHRPAFGLSVVRAGRPKGLQDAAQAEEGNFHGLMEEAFPLLEHLLPDLVAVHIPDGIDKAEVRPGLEHPRLGGRFTDGTSFKPK